MKLKFCLILTLILFGSCSFIQNFNFRECEANSYSIKEREWTIMYYMAADNNLESDALNDVNILESFDFSQENISTICLLDRSVGHDESDNNWVGTRLYEIKQDKNGENSTVISKQCESLSLSLSVENPIKLNMSDGKNLEKFLKHCYENYPAKRYALILWGHSGGWKTMFVDDSSVATMPLVELQKSIKNSFSETSVQKLDFICFDSAFSCNLETIWELKNLASYFFGNVDVGNIDGIDYNRIYSHYFSSLENSQSLTNSFLTQNDGSLIDMTQLEDLQVSFNNLAKILAHCVQDTSSLSLMRTIFLEDTKYYMATELPSDKFLSIYDICLQIENNIDNVTGDVLLKQEILHAVTEVKTAMKNCVNSTNPEISVFLTTMQEGHVLPSSFDSNYVQNFNNSSQIDFITDTNYWTPTKEKNYSLLDKIFFTQF